MSPSGFAFVLNVSILKSKSENQTWILHLGHCVATRGIGLEISKVLQYPQVAKILSEVGVWEKDVLRMAANTLKAEPKTKLHANNEDAEDNKILECAWAAGADVIVTGDKHLLELGKFKKTKIPTPKEFFDSFA